MSKKSKLDYFILDSDVDFCHFMGCSGHKNPITQKLLYHTLFEVICCSIFEWQELCKRCQDCYFCTRVDYFISEFNKLDKLNSAENDTYWNKVYFDLDLANPNSFGNILGIEKIIISRELAEKFKLV